MALLKRRPRLAANARRLGFGLGLAALVTLSAKAQAGSADEYSVKAAYLYNFARFVEWPAETVDPGLPLVIAVLGQDAFGAVLKQAVQSETVNGRAISVRSVSRLEDLRYCHILFFGSSNKTRLAEVLRVTAGAGVLTVGETEEFLRLGGVIAFVPEGNKIRFEINLGAARRNRLTISARLLSVAKGVRE
jgi:hypothetical protein